MDVLVFGCGGYFLRKKKTIFNLYNIVAVIDTFKRGEIQLSDDRSVNIYSPEEGLKKYENLPVVIAVKDFIAISNQLISLGVLPERIIFSQNMEPYGPEEIVFNHNQKILL